MKKIFISASFLAFSAIAFAQAPKVNINKAEVLRIEKTLSSDEMEGRRTFTPGIDKAAEFIAEEFKKSGIQPAGNEGYFQTFYMYKTGALKGSLNVNGATVATEKVIAISINPTINVDNSYEKMHIGASDTWGAAYQKAAKSTANTIVTVDPAHERLFNSLKRRNNHNELPNNLIFVLSAEPVTDVNGSLQLEVSKQRLRNVMGILPGKSKKSEIVIFSSHYDHLGIGKPTAEGDSIYNGANDNAAGTTAVIMLANHFAKQKNNERTIVFVAFTAEEVGGFGSQYFSKQYDPKDIIAMFNIEMIGTDSQWGKNSAYITGYDKSSMGEILKKNLVGTNFTFYPDPYTAQNLFYRSDNATLARLGVPAHTISTAKMEGEKHYHTQDDEIETLDIDNMTEIIKAIAISSTSIIKGTDTPSRVDTTQLR